MSLPHKGNVMGWMLADHRDGLSSSSFLAWSSLAQSVCQRAFSLLDIRLQSPYGFESCIQQRKTTCLLSIRKSLACARASKLITTNTNKVNTMDADVQDYWLYRICVPLSSRKNFLPDKCTNGLPPNFQESLDVIPAAIGNILGMLWITIWIQAVFHLEAECISVNNITEERMSVRHNIDTRNNK